jgi:hypothetical protein
MNRRKFLSLIAAAPAALILPELLLPKRSFFLPPAGGWTQPRLTEMWLDYADLVRPAYVAVNVVRLSTIPEIRVVETAPWLVTLEMPFAIDAETERRMRRALSQLPTYDHYHGTIASLMPWATHE